MEGQGLAWLVMRAALGALEDAELSQLGRTVRTVVAERLPAHLREALTAPAGRDGD